MVINYEIYYALIFIMLSRLFFYIEDHPLTFKKFVIKLFIGTIPFVIFIPIWKMILLFFLLIIINVIFYILENKRSNLNLIRAAEFVTVFILLNIFFSSAAALEFNMPLLNGAGEAGKYFLALNEVKYFDWGKILIVSACFVFLLNEINIFIRIIFNLFNLAPVMPVSDERAENKEIIDSGEYNAGRIIGMLERIIIFIFVLFGAYSAIGLIVAAKAFARFKALEDRSFAEYVLIGTLISSLAAIAVSIFTLYLLG